MVDDDVFVGKYFIICYVGVIIMGFCIGFNDVSNFILSFYYNYIIVNG